MWRKFFLAKICAIFALARNALKWTLLQLGIAESISLMEKNVFSHNYRRTENELLISLDFTALCKHLSCKLCLSAQGNICFIIQCNVMKYVADTKCCPGRTDISLSLSVCGVCWKVGYLNRPVTESCGFVYVWPFNGYQVLKRWIEYMSQSIRKCANNVL